MPTFVLRVWLPDRPGALGAVASRIGAATADVVGIEIIERGAGRAVDELTVELADPDLIDLLVSEVRNVDGVDVEDVREVGGHHDDLAVTALEVAAGVARAGEPTTAAISLVEGAQRLLRADWAALVDLEEATLIASCGEDVPNAAWICGYVQGTRARPTLEEPAELDELAVAPVPAHGWHLVVCRQQLPLRGRERALLDRLGALG